LPAQFPQNIPPSSTLNISHSNFPAILLRNACCTEISRRDYVAKEINFEAGARATLLQGVIELAEAVKVTMAPKVSNVRNCIRWWANICRYINVTQVSYSNLRPV
ncbi:hypothetical protein Dimus_004165, partial [Dionaea muscipula]